MFLNLFHLLVSINDVDWDHIGECSVARNHWINHLSNISEPRSEDTVN